MKKLVLALAAFLPLAPSLAQNFIPNYDEEKVPDYVLPDPLRFANGQRVESAADWENRKLETLRLFEEEMFGISPAWDGQMRVQELSRNEEALGGKAVQREVKLTLERKGQTVDLVLLTFLPKGVDKAPMFVGLNFYGNHTISMDEAIQVTKSWIRNNADMGYTNNQASDRNRGSRVTNWPVQDMVDRGYGLATLYYGDIDPDFDDGFANGVHALFLDEVRNENSWGSVAAWAWGISRVVDYLEDVPGVDRGRLAVVGHSRLGKAALWAAAVDPRFSMAISNNSGCGGAALSRRRFGETVERINTSFPHWFNQRFRYYNKEEDSLPMDQHQLIALLAPNPVYIASAADDLWADPKGEFLSAVAATPVYQFLGKEGMPVSEWPSIEVPVMGTLGYHVRTGGHGMLYYDWMQYLDFADKHWK
ncbi:MAG: acetylxylan esterase [Lunatimonas sp.]|uniref:glucuronyl esterase domain-containing protein n=1 Tax=Lunatimonas sp. TaxID=2060141 RepID=UPI00263B52DC|nr:acetylxylan esterase [Lunatimonas sp.]MCC5939241.1 acetylxylan esterase [Lunatimonas sp.]